jgi:hypothetical protein
MPLWLIFLFALLFYWGQLYLDSNAAGFDPRGLRGLSRLCDLKKRINRVWAVTQNSWREGKRYTQEPACSVTKQLD